MAILIGKDTKLITQGITGKAGLFHSQKCRDYGTNVVGGVAPQIWHFSTRDPELAKRLSSNVGRQLRIHYSEHRGVPSTCFAETPYFAESFTMVSGER